MTKTPHSRNFASTVFTFTKRERSGLISVCVLLCFVWVACQWCVTLFSPEKLPSDLIWSPELEPEVTMHSALDTNHNFRISESSDQREMAYPFSFNPNLLDYDSLVLAGFSSRAAKNLVRYRAKGGVVRNLEKLKSIYGVDTNWVNRVASYIRFTPEPSNEGKRASGQVSAVPQRQLSRQDEPPTGTPLEINTADSAALLGVKGIGPAICRRILQMRRRLGGFLDLNQLTDLKILPDSVYHRIRPFLRVDKTAVTPINLNTADFSTFYGHPLFDKQTINAILQYRKQHGSFSDVLHIRRIRSLDPERGEKIIPYLKVTD